MGYLTYEMSVLDPGRAKPQAALATGGKLLVCTAGRTAKATLYNPDSSFAALTNPISFSRGRVRFSTLDTVESVDIYGFAPTGHFISFRGVKPMAENEFFINTRDNMQVAHIPFSYADYTAATETDTGLDMPTGAMIVPGAHVRVTAADSGITLEFGFLSTESSGDPDGLIDAISLATAGTIAPSVLLSTATLGALLRSLGGTTPEIAIPRDYPIAAANVSLSITPSSGWDTGEGFVVLPYILQPL